MSSLPVPPNVSAYRPRSKRQLRIQQFIRGAAYRVWRRHLSKHARFKPFEPVGIFDVGCGPGYFLREAKRWFPAAKVTGLDYEIALLDWVNLPDATLVQGSAESLPFADNSFDVVSCLQVLEHLKDPDKAISELKRVLKPGGFVCVATPNLACWSAKVAGASWHGYRDDHIALRSARDWNQALEQGGLRVVEEGTTLFSGMPVLRVPPLILISWIPLFFFGHFPWPKGESDMAFCQKEPVI